MFGNVNKLILLGRLTRDPEERTFSNGGKMATFGFAVSNRRKDKNGEWIDEPMFIDCKVFQGEKGSQVDNLVRFLSKGDQAYLEGPLVLEQWESDGQKRSKHTLKVENFQVLKPRDGQQTRQDTPDNHIPSNTTPPDDDVPF